MVRSGISAQEALKVNKTIRAINIIPSGSTDMDDYFLFPTVPSPPTQPNTNRSAVVTNSILCDQCQISLEYYAYVLEDQRASRTENKESPNVFSFVHHHTLSSVLLAADANCHLCFFLACFLRVPVDPQDSTGLKNYLSETQVEMSWNSDFYNEGDQRRERLHFALTNPDLERTTENYRPCLRLDVSPNADSQLFNQPQSVRGQLVANSIDRCSEFLAGWYGTNCVVSKFAGLFHQ